MPLTRRRSTPAPSVPRLRGTFTAAHAERLLWRAGFGPRPGDVARVQRLGLDGAVRSLTRPASGRLAGPAPRVEGGLAPRDAWGHDGLWWLDRMVRSEAPLVERMALVWHDWFATSRATVDARWMLAQNGLFRRRALGDFGLLVHDVTRDPAMLLWLNGTENRRGAINENLARELMELFTLGANAGYGERDVREAARAMSGWRNDWREGVGATRFRFDPEQHDPGVKRVLGTRGRLGWEDVARLVVAHPAHARFFVRKLWSAFVPVPPDTRTRRALETLYVRSGRQVRPVVEAILRHPALLEGPRMVKPPIVFIAGLLRATGRGIDTEAWTWISRMAGQQLFFPPNVAGWDETAWLDTATWRGRWVAVNEALDDGGTLAVDARNGELLSTQTPAEAVDAALAHWASPTVTPETHARLTAFADGTEGLITASWKRLSVPVLRQNALRALVATSPDFHTS